MFVWAPERAAAGSALLRFFCVAKIQATQKEPSPSHPWRKSCVTALAYSHNFYYLNFLKKISLILFCLLSFCLYAQPDSSGVETGIASYYAKAFEGRKTSSGERFKHALLTAAHKTLPFGTCVKITNLKNDSVVIVKINDRLPPRSKRCIDLTMTAAKQLNFVRAGLVKVKLELLKDSLP